MNSSNKAYLEVLNKRITEINRAINLVEIKIKNSKFTLARDEKKLIALQKELKKLNEEKTKYETTNDNDYKEKLSIDILDSYYDRKEEKREKIEEEKKRLKELREELKTKKAKNKVLDKIKRKEEKLKKLNKKEVHIIGAQRNIIISKRILLNRKNKMYSKQEAQVDYYNNKKTDIQSLRNNLDKNQDGLKGLKDSILDYKYQIKEKYYTKKEKKHTEILNIMQEKKVGIKSANIIILKKKLVDKLRKNRDNQQNNTNQNNNTDTDRKMLPAVIK